MRKTISILFGAVLSLGATAQKTLTFDADAGVRLTLTVHDGTEVSCTAYMWEDIWRRQPRDLNREMPQEGH